MAENKKMTASEKDGVQYRRAKTWQIICFACQALIGMSVYQLIGMASYAGSLGFGIATAAIGVILTCTRILDGITDPFLAFVYDKVDTKFGKVRILLITGYVIEAIALMAMFSWAPGHFNGVAGLVVFVLLYVVYVIGYTIANMTAQTILPLISNDPKQRPMIGVWNTALNYLVPIVLTLVFNVVMLPMFGGTYNLPYLSAVAKLSLAVALAGVIIVCIGVSEYDKPENFKGLTQKKEPLKIKDMVGVLKHNKPLQKYIIAASSDKFAQITASQSVIVTMLYGIIIGNMSLSTVLSVIAMLPSIIFAFFGAKYAGSHGSKNAIMTWTKVCMVVGVIAIVFFAFGDPTKIATMFSPMMIGYVLITLFFNGSKMCVTTANTAFMSDIIDYELDRSGKYIPAVVTGTASFIDKIISSFGTLLASLAAAMVGYVNTVPQPGDPSTPAIFWVTIMIMYGLPLLGWLCTLLALRNCDLDREHMIEVQKRIAERKAALKEEQEA